MTRVRKRKNKNSKGADGASDAPKELTPEEEEQSKRFLLVVGVIFALIVVTFIVLQFI